MTTVEDLQGTDAAEPNDDFGKGILDDVEVQQDTSPADESAPESDVGSAADAPTDAPTNTPMNAPMKTENE